jgi:5-hydroxyisourate hydrolase
MKITTHVLDTSRGRPAPSVDFALEKESGGGWQSLGVGKTDNDGRGVPLASGLEKGRYRLTFDTGAYFAALKIEAFYPSVSIVFEVREPTHHHVPLLLSPFGFSTYRGS